MKLNKFFFHLIQNQEPPEINSDGFLLCHIFLQGAVHNNIAYHISVCPVWLLPGLSRNLLVKFCCLIYIHPYAAVRFLLLLI